MRKFLNILYIILVIQILCILSTSAIAQFQQKPMLGVQVDGAHPHGDFVAAWFFNEGSGNIVSDLSGNGFNGTLVGGDVTWISGLYGSALNFPGTSGDYVNCGDMLIIDGIPSLTYLLWVNFPDETPVADNYLIGKWDGGAPSHSYFRLEPDNQLVLAVYNEAGTRGRVYASGKVVANKWHCIVGVYDGAYVKIYVDGVDESDSSVSLTGDTYSATVAPLLIGTLVAGAGEIDAQISHVLIYNRALSAYEIALLYSEPFAMFVKDDIAILATAAEPPPAPTGQVITIIMSAIPLFLIPFFFIKRRKLRR